MGGDDAVGAALCRQPSPFAGLGRAVQVTRGDDKVQRRDKAPPLLHYDEDRTPAERGDAVGAAGAGNPASGLRIGAADVGRVDIAIGIDLQRSEHAIIDEAL
jgi:hypothetical protein